MDTLTRIVSGSIRRRARGLGVPEQHQLKIALDSMRKHCVGLAILDGQNHFTAARVIEQLTGAIVGIDTDCTCNRA